MISDIVISFAIFRGLNYFKANFYSDTAAEIISLGQSFPN